MPGGDGRDDINAPLPVKSREEVLQWATKFTRTMAEQAHATIRPQTESDNFSNCVGKNDEIARDGRFKLLYYVRAELDSGEHIAAAARVRTALEARGYEVSGTREDPGAEKPVILDMEHGEENVLASAESTGPDSMTFSVATGCFLPPGVEQQQF